MATNFKSTPVDQISLNGKNFQAWMEIQLSEIGVRDEKTNVLKHLQRFWYALGRKGDSETLFAFTEKFFGKRVLDPVLIAGFTADMNGQGNYRNEALDAKLFQWSAPQREYLRKNGAIFDKVPPQITDPVGLMSGFKLPDDFLETFTEQSLGLMATDILPEMVFGGAYLAIENLMLSVWILGNYDAIHPKLPVETSQSLFFWNWLLVVKFLYIYNIGLWSVRSRSAKLNTQMVQNMKYIFAEIFFTVTLGKDLLSKTGSDEAGREFMFSPRETRLNTWMTFRQGLNKNVCGHFDNFFHLLSVKNVEASSYLRKQACTELSAVFLIAAPSNPFFFYNAYKLKGTSPNSPVTGYDLFGDAMVTGYFKTVDNYRNVSFSEQFILATNTLLNADALTKKATEPLRKHLLVFADTLSFFGIAVFVPIPRVVKGEDGKTKTLPDEIVPMPDFQIDHQALNEFLSGTSTPTFFQSDKSRQTRQRIEEFLQTRNGFDYSKLDVVTKNALMGKIRTLKLLYGHDTVSEVNTANEFGYSTYHRGDVNLAYNDMEWFIDEERETPFMDPDNLTQFRFVLQTLAKKLGLLDRFFPSDDNFELASFCGMAYTRAFTSWISDFLSVYKDVTLDDFHQSRQGAVVLISSLSILFYALTGETTYILVKNRSGKTEASASASAYLRKKAIYIYLHCVANRAAYVATSATSEESLPDNILGDQVGNYLYLKASSPLPDDEKGSYSANWKKICGLEPADAIEPSEEGGAVKPKKSKTKSKPEALSFLRDSKDFPEESVFPFKWLTLEGLGSLVDPHFYSIWPNRPFKIATSSSQMQILISNLLCDMAPGIIFPKGINSPLKDFVAELDDDGIIGLLRGDYFSLRGNGISNEMLHLNRQALLRWCKYDLGQTKKPKWECNLYAAPVVYERCGQVIAGLCFEFWTVFLHYAQGPFGHKFAEEKLVDRLRSKACALEIIRAMRRMIDSMTRRRTLDAAIESMNELSEFIDGIYSNQDFGADSFAEIVKLMGDVFIQRQEELPKHKTEGTRAWKIFRLEFDEFCRCLEEIDEYFFFSEEENPRNDKNFIDNSIFLTRRYEWSIQDDAKASSAKNEKSHIIAEFLQGKGKGKNLLHEVLMLNKFVLRNEDTSEGEGHIPLENRVLALLELMAMDTEYLTTGSDQQKREICADYQEGPFLTAPYWDKTSELIVADWNQIFFDFSLPKGEGFQERWILKRWIMIERFVKNRAPSMQTKMAQSLAKITPNLTLLPEIKISEDSFDYRENIFSLIVGESVVDLFVLAAAALVSPSGNAAQHKGFIGLVDAYKESNKNGASQKWVAQCIHEIVSREYGSPLSEQEKGRQFRVALNVVGDELDKLIYTPQPNSAGTSGKRKAEPQKKPPAKRAKIVEVVRKTLKGSLDEIVRSLPPKDKPTQTPLTEIWEPWKKIVEDLKPRGISEKEKILSVSMAPYLFAVKYFQQKVGSAGDDGDKSVYYNVLLKSAASEALAEISSISKVLTEDFSKARVGLRSKNSSSKNIIDLYEPYLQALGELLKAELVSFQLKIFRNQANKSMDPQKVLDLKKKLTVTAADDFTVWCSRELGNFVAEKRKFLAEFLPGIDEFGEERVRSLFLGAIGGRATEERELFEDLSRAMISVVLQREFASSESAFQHLTKTGVLDASLAQDNFAYPLPRLGQFPSLPLLREDIESSETFPTLLQCVEAGVGSLRETSYPDPIMYLRDLTDSTEDTSEVNPLPSEDEEGGDEEEEEEEEEGDTFAKAFADGDDDDDDEDFKPVSESESEDEDISDASESEDDDGEKNTAQAGSSNHPPPPKSIKDNVEKRNYFENLEDATKETIRREKSSRNFIFSLFPLQGIVWDNLESQNSYLPLNKFPLSWCRLLLRYAPRQGFENRELDANRLPVVAHSIDKFKKDFNYEVDKIVLSNDVWSAPNANSSEYGYIKAWVAGTYRKSKRTSRPLTISAHLQSLKLSSTLDEMARLLGLPNDDIQLDDVYNSILNMTEDDFRQFFSGKVATKDPGIPFLLICVLRIVTYKIASTDFETFVDNAGKSHPGENNHNPLYDVEI